MRFYDFLNETRLNVKRMSISEIEQFLFNKFKTKTEIIKWIEYYIKKFDINSEIYQKLGVVLKSLLEEKNSSWAILHGVVNGEIVKLPNGLEDLQNRNTRIYTILNKETILKDGKPNPIMWENAFLDDPNHDWTISNGTLRFYAHSSEKGQKVSILILRKEGK